MCAERIPIDIPFGSTRQRVEVPAGQLAGVCWPAPAPTVPNPEEHLRRVIQEGLERTGITRKAKPGARVCLAVTDRTRSTPNQQIVPILIDELEKLGIRDEDITIMVGVGMHAADSPEAIEANLGPAVARRFPVLNNEPDNQPAMVHLGTTSLGTPVEVHRRFAEADIRIGTGLVNPCMLAGWSAGGKIVLPGVASRRCIYENHKRFTGILAELHCSSLLGVMPPANIVRSDLEEAADIAGIDMVVDVLLDAGRNLVAAFADAHLPAHRAAVEFMRPYVEVALPEKVDIMIAGVGDIGYEVSLFQGGSRVCGGVDRYLKPGGTLILVNQCREGIYEGFEHEEFRQWMREMPTPAELRRLTEALEIGGEKSCVLYTFSWLLHEMKCRIVVVAEGMGPAELHEVHLEYAAHVQPALEAALAEYGPGASVGVMPYGALVLPVLQD